MNHNVRSVVADACRVLAANGAGDLIWGHASARDPDGRGAWLKQASFGLEEITAERVHLVDRDGSVLQGGGQRHAEYPIHTEILAARPDVGGVVHVHPRHAVALAASGQPLRPVSHEATLFTPPGVPRFTDTADLVLTAELGQAVAACLGSADAVFLVNHGIVCVGPDIETATVTTVLLERACAQQILTQSIEATPSWSPDDEAVRKRANIYTDLSMHQAWDYLVRMLP